MEADDFKFMTEGGGGGMGDPLLLVQKYFGPKVASAVAKLDGQNDIQLFAERLVSVKDAKVIELQIDSLILSLLT